MRSLRRRAVLAAPRAGEVVTQGRVKQFGRRAGRGGDVTRFLARKVNGDKGGLLRPSFFIPRLRANPGSVPDVSTCRGRPIRTGWNSTAATIVHSSDSAISLPMLDMPGYFDAHMLPNATAVVMALNTTARVSVDCSRPVFHGAPRHDVIDLERDADAEQQRQRDDVGEFERETDEHADLEREDAGEQEGMSVSSTSVIRRNAISSRMAIAAMARTPASMKADVTVFAAS